MSIRQSILKAIYPFTMSTSKGAMGTIRLNTEKQPPQISFHDLHFTGNNGKEINMAEYKGIKVLVVNTASDCGYTHQYEALETLYKKMGGKLVIIGFPANDFKEQEKGSDADIAQFCQLNYGVTFPLAKKASVIKPNQQPVFKWLSDKNENGWNDKQPQWNFCKYLVDENGVLLGYFGPAVGPLDKELISLL